MANNSRTNIRPPSSLDRVTSSPSDLNFDLSSVRDHSSSFRRRFRQYLSICILAFGSVTLIATSPSDIPSINRSLEVKLTEGAEQVDLSVRYNDGPVNFSDYPLVISLRIVHEDPAESFDFERQSWTVVTETTDGAQQRRLVVLKQGSDNVAQFTVDQSEVSLSGIINLYVCDEDEAGSISAPLCIPCSVSDERCDFTLSLLRQGAPYPAEVIELDLSQWTTEDSSFNLDVSRR